MDQQTNDLIKGEIENNDVCLFMKGTPDAPQCGLSMAVVKIFKIVEIPLLAENLCAMAQRGELETLPKRFCKSKLFIL